MNIAILKPCNYVGCNQLVEYGQKYCNKHKGEDKDRYKQYKNNRLKDYDEIQRQRFYSSKEWIKLRDVIRLHYFGIDIVEYYSTGRIVSGKVVHHILPIKDYWNQRLNKNNLIYLTEENHQRIHSRIEESKEEEKKVIKELFNIIERFHEEFY